MENINVMGEIFVFICLLCSVCAETKLAIKK